MSATVEHTIHGHRVQHCTRCGTLVARFNRRGTMVWYQACPDDCAESPKAILAETEQVIAALADELNVPIDRGLHPADQLREIKSELARRNQ